MRDARDAHLQDKGHGEFIHLLAKERDASGKTNL